MYAEYIVEIPFRSPDATHTKGKKLAFHTFKKGDIVTGFIFENPNPNVKAPEGIIANDMWFIPLANVSKLRDLSQQQAEEMTLQAEEKEKQPDPEKKSTVDQVFEKMENMDLVKSVVNRSQSTVTGMVWGAAAGFLLGLVFFKRPVGGMITGLIAGYFVGNRFLSPKQLENLRKSAETTKQEVTQASV